MSTKQEPVEKTDDISILIATVMAADPKDRGRVRKQLLDAYPHDDVDTVERWLDEALALEVVDTI